MALQSPYLLYYSPLNLESSLNILVTVGQHVTAGQAIIKCGEGGSGAQVFGGGPVLTANPEPYAAFFDVVLLGDGEDLLSNFLEAYSGNRLAEFRGERPTAAAPQSRTDLLRALSAVLPAPGFLVRVLVFRLSPPSAARRFKSVQTLQAMHPRVVGFRAITADRRNPCNC